MKTMKWMMVAVMAAVLVFMYGARAGELDPTNAPASTSATRWASASCAPCRSLGEGQTPLCLSAKVAAARQERRVLHDWSGFFNASPGRQ